MQMLNHRQVYLINFQWLFGFQRILFYRTYKTSMFPSIHAHSVSVYYIRYELYVFNGKRLSTDDDVVDDKLSGFFTGRIYPTFNHHCLHTHTHKHHIELIQSVSQSVSQVTLDTRTQDRSTFDYKTTHIHILYIQVS